MAWRIIDWNPFGGEKAPENEGTPAPADAATARDAATTDLTQYGEAYSPMQAFGQTATSPKEALTPPPPERPRGAAAFADPQQYIEVAKGVPPGAVSFVGTGMQGLGAVPAVGQANAFKFGRQQEALWDRIDRGEAVPDMDDAAGYQHMTPDQRRSARADATKAKDAFQPVILAEQPLYKAGERVKEFAKTILPAAPGYEDAFGRQIGEGLGSLLAGLPFGAAGRIPGAIFFGAGGAGEAGTRAIAWDQAEKRAGRAGLTQEQINAASLYGIGPGTTDLLPVEVLLGRLRVPAALTKPFAAAIGRIGGQAFIEGAQEGGQAFLQNVIAQDYNPEQGLTQGVGGEAAVGGAVGAVAQGLRDVASLPLAGLTGRRGAASGPDAAPSADPFAQPLTPAPNAEGSFSPLTPPQPIDVDFTDLIPADRRITQGPAPQADGLPSSPAPLRSEFASSSAAVSPEGLPVPATAPPSPGAVQEVASVLLQNFWNVAKQLDAKLDGEPKQAIDDWVGGQHDAANQGFTGGIMLPRRLESMPDDQLEAMAQPVRNALRATVGDTITVYRGEIPGQGQSAGRQNKLMAYSTNPNVAAQIAGAGPQLPVIGEEEIQRAEQQLQQSGRAEIGGYTLQFNPAYGGYIDLYRNGQHITDTPGVRAIAEQNNAWAREQNAKREAALKNVRTVQIPVDSVVWATDRFNQKEIIARADQVQEQFGTTQDRAAVATNPMAAPQMVPPAGGASTADVLSTMAQPEARRGGGVLQFIRSKGGLKPSRELMTMDALRYPGLINRNGLSADKMREAMVEAGYLAETGPDQPAVTTPSDVFDLLSREISGERVVPQVDQRSDEAFFAAQRSREDARELQAAEQNFVIPEIRKYDAEMGGEFLWNAYNSLDPQTKAKVIDRNRRGEDIVDVLEEITTQDPIYYALGAPLRDRRERDELGFYSKAKEAANALQRKAGPPSGFLNDLTKAGVTKNEIQATGLDKFLESKGQIVTKQEIIDHLGRNQVNIQESRYGGKAADPRLRITNENVNDDGTVDFDYEDRDSGLSFIVNVDDDAGNVTVQGPGGRFIPINRPQNRQQQYDAEEAITAWLQQRGMPDDVMDEAQWKGYSIDKENPTYRETVIHLKMPPISYEKWLANSATWGRDVKDTPSNRAEYDMLSRTGSLDEKIYTTGHWPEANIVAHVRHQLVKSTDGRTSFNIDELQSDWGQNLRDEGVRDEGKVENLRRQEQEAVDAYNAAVSEADRQFIETFSKAFAATGETLPGEALNHRQGLKRGDGPALAKKSRALGMNDLASFLDERGLLPEESKKLSDALTRVAKMSREADLKRAELKTAQSTTRGHPLVNDTQQWVTTAMRRVIQLAAESGADGISITPGKVEAERYPNLIRKSIRELSYNPAEQALDYRRQVGTQWERWTHPTTGKETVAPEELRGVIGKDFADALLSAPVESDGAHVLSDLDGITIGGQGMLENYDKRYPNVLGKLLQKLDPSIKPEKVKLNPHNYTGRERIPLDELRKGTPFENEFIFFPLTEKAKQKLEEEGQPLFALGAGNGRNKRAPDEAGDVLAALSGQTETAAFKRWFGDSKVVGFGGEPKMVYHATLSDFEAFSKGAANPESDMGAGFYFTDTPEDAASNYAHEGGPDIRNRIELAVDRLLGDDDFLAPIIENNKGLTPDDDGWINEGDAAREAAKVELSMANEGLTLPVYLSIKNPVVIGDAVKVGGPQEATFFDFDDGEVYDEEADEYEYGEPSGKLAEFFQALRAAGDEFDVSAADIDEVIGGLYDEARDNGGLPASRVIAGVKADERLLDVYDQDGRMATPELVRRALEKMGYDGIIDNTVSSKWGQERPFGGMEGVYPDTIHYIAFKPNQIKSAIGNRGTFDPNDDRIAYALKGFYSPAIRATEKLKQEKATADQWWSMITKSPGIRMEELQWMGLKQWLDEQAKPEYGPEERHLFINGDKLNEVFPNVHERITARAALDGAGYKVPAAVESIRAKIAAGGYGQLADAATAAAEHLTRLSNAEFEFRNTAPIVREARKTIPKADMLSFMAQHQMELEDKILGGKNPNAVDSDGEIDWDEYEDEINERADEIYDELRQERDDEELSEWERNNDPDNLEVHVEPNVGQTRMRLWDNEVMGRYRAAVANFNEWQELQLALPGIGHAVARPKLKDFIPEDFWGEDGVPDFIYTLVNQGPGQDIESRDSFDTYEEALAAAEADLEKRIENYDDNRDRARDEIWTEDYHDLQGDARRQARDEIQERVQEERANERPDEDADEVDEDDTGEGITEYGGPTQFKQYSIPGGEDYRELMVRFPQLEGQYTSWHYKDQELVHIRLDTRHRKGGGEKTLLIHEIQSDLHQRSRGFGFGAEGRVKALEAQAAGGWTPEATTENAAVMARREALFQEYSGENWPGPVPDEVKAEIATLNDRIQKLEERRTARSTAANRYISTFGRLGAPEAPYTGNAWWELGFKRAVQYAVEQGFDAVALTSPDQISKASYTPEDVAKQFYGESVPRFANKYLKQWGVKPEKAELSGTDDVEYIAPDNITLDQAIDYFRAIGRHYRAKPNMTYYAERMEGIAAALEITKPQTTEAILQIAEAEAPGRTALREGAPGIEPLFRKEAVNPFWRITDEMKAAIKEHGQALAKSGDAAQAARNVGAMLRMGRAVTFQHADAVLEAAQPYSTALPNNADVVALSRVEPVKGQRGIVRAIFKASDGSVVVGHEAPWDEISSMRAFFRASNFGAKGRVFLVRLTEPSGASARLAGEVRHESIHALRRSGAIPAEVWSELLGHAKRLRILEVDLRKYLQAIGDPDYLHVEPGLKIINEYLHAYKGTSDIRERIDQEYVAHMAELYSHGKLGFEELGEIQGILDDIFAGEYSDVRAKSVSLGGSGIADQAFAGPWAKTASQNKLIQAQKLAATGTDPFTIWKRTGWYKAVDGRWKFEVDDSGSTLFPLSLKKFVESKVPVRLGKLLDHPELYKAYSDLRDVLVVANSDIAQDGAGYMGTNTKEEIGEYYTPSLPREFFILGTKPVASGDIDAASMRSALLHEAQHWIQQKEGFALGANNKVEARAFEDRARTGAFTTHDREVSEMPMVLDIGKKMSALADMLAKEKNPSDELIEAARYYKRRYLDVVGFFLYQRVAGEVEAREVQRRRDLSPDERRETWPSPTPNSAQRFVETDRPYGDDMLALAGRRAIGAPKQALAAGEAMETRGRSPEAIWQATGTMRGIEGKQRWEIDDSGAKVIGLDKAFQTPKKTGFISRLLGRAPAPKPGIKEANNVPLLNVLHHPKLYNAYPFLRQMRVNLAFGDQAFKEGALRSKQGDNTRIYKPIEASGRNPQELLEVLMHEIQHYIQDREGFARGSDVVRAPPTKFGDNSTALYDPGQDLTEEERKDWRFAAPGPTLLKMTRPESIAMQIIDAYERLDQAKSDRDTQRSRQDIEELGKRLEESMLVKGEDYLSSYGEAEARAVESRLWMPPAERRAHFPGAYLPENLRDTSSQTRDYNKAYDEVMRRARVFKDIKARWAQRKDLGDGISVVRPDEEFLIYTQGQEDGLIEAKTNESGADVSVWPEFLEKPYAQQKKAMDMALRDLRSRNMRPEVAYPSEINDQELAFWARYDPRMIAFEPRLYRDRIEEMARELYGDDVEVAFHDTGEVVVSSPEMRRNAEAAQEKIAKAQKSWDEYYAKMIEKYGSIADMFQKGEPSEIMRYGTLARQADDMVSEHDREDRHLDLTPIFGDRLSQRRAPEGVDQDMWWEALIDEQLAATGKMPRAGDDVDFRDLIPRQ